MATVEFSNEEKEIIVDKVQRYFEKELDQEISQFDSEFLIDFFSKQIGDYYYNKGLRDAQNLIHLKLEDMVYELEKPTDFFK